MPDLNKFINAYNQFIEDLKHLFQDIVKVIEKEFKLQCRYNYWSPRDRSAWANKEKFYFQFYPDSEEYVLTLGFNLLDDIPYLFISRIDVDKGKLDKKGEKIDGYNCDWWAHEPFQNNDFTRIKINEFITKASCPEDWSTNNIYFCKISIESITSTDLVNTALKNVVKHFIDGDYELMEKFNEIEFIE